MQERRDRERNIIIRGIEEGREYREQSKGNIERKAESGDKRS